MSLFPSLFFTVDVQHSHDLAEVLRASGIRAYPLSGKTEKEERRRFVRLFKEGELDGLVSCGVLCLDGETEILTRDGWVGKDEITQDHLVANWNTDGTVFFKRPKSIVVRDRLPGERMVSTKNQRHDIRVTEDHRIVFKPGGQCKWRVEHAADVTGRKIIIPCSGYAEAEEISPAQPIAPSGRRLGRMVTSLAYVYRKRGGMESSVARDMAAGAIQMRYAMQRQKPSELTLDQCRLIGFWIGDGTRGVLQSGGLEYSMCQSTAYPSIIKWVDSLIKRVGLDVVRREMEAPQGKISGKPYVKWSLSRGTGYGKQKRRGLFSIEPYLNKNGTRLFWGLSEEQFDGLIEGLWYADGDHLSGEEVPDSLTIHCFNKRLADILQAVGSCRGHYTSLREATRKEEWHQQGYRLLFRKQSEFMLLYDHFEFEESELEEEVWCVTNHSSYLITRRNGRVAVLGNTEGFDSPNAIGGFMARPTQSGLLYRQMCGRLLRPFPAPTGPRQYQQEALRAILRTIQEESIVNQLLVLPTGTGKTFVSAKIPQVVERWKPQGQRGRMLFLVHRDELAYQAADTFRALTNKTVGVEKAKERAGDAEIVVGSVQTLGPAKVDVPDDGEARFEYGPRLMALNPDHFDAVVVDECFVPETLVDGVSIDRRRVGELVTSLNHSDGTMAMGTVTRVFRSCVKRLLRVWFSDGSSLACTTSHPFWRPDQGRYAPADQLPIGGMVLAANHLYNGVNGNARLRQLPEEPREDRHCLTDKHHEVPGESILLRRLPEGIQGAGLVGDDGSDQPEIRFGADAGEEPDAQPASAGEGKDIPTGYGVGSDRARRQRHRGYGSADATGLGLGVGDGSRGPDPRGKGERASDLLQAGYRERCHEGGDRGGRVLAPTTLPPSPGFKEAGVLGVLRVDRIEVLEPGSDGEFERLCPGGIVYNLEVAGHNNYFANGILVHNCHHAVKGKYYHNILRRMRCLKGEENRDNSILLLLITATPNRSDNAGMEVVADKIVYDYSIRDAITQGYLARPRGFRIETEFDLSQVNTTNGDFNLDELQAQVNTPLRNELIAREYLLIRAAMKDELESHMGRKPCAVIADFVDISAKHSLITAPTIFGLRDKFDPQGRDLESQAEEVEQMEAEQEGLDLREEGTIEAAREKARLVKTQQRVVDLMRAGGPQVPPEFRKLTKLPWAKEGEGAYHLSCMESGMVSVRQNQVGQWEVARHQKSVRSVFCVARSVEEAISKAEQEIPRQERDALRTDAAWRSDPPSEAQARRIMVIDKHFNQMFRGRTMAFYEYAKARYDAGDPLFSKGGLSDRMNRLETARR